MNEQSAGERSRKWGWLLLGVLLLGQYGLFRQHVIEEIAWAYPRGYDQTGYLTLAYHTYEAMKEKGVFRGLKQGLVTQVDTGVMMHNQAALLFLVGGPSRLSALTLNFLYFALLQVVLASTLLWLTRRWSPALFGVGLLLTAIAPFYFAGGMMDFRIDFIAFCLFGTFLCAVIRSGLFDSRRWSLAVGGVAGLCITFRFLTTVYLFVVMGAMFLLLCVRALLARDPIDRKEAARRLLNLTCSGLVVVTLAAPIVWLQWTGLHNHYIDHVQNAELAVRQKEVGTVGLSNRLFFYPRSIARDHAGEVFLKLAAMSLAAAVVVGRLRFGQRPSVSVSGVALRGPLLVSVACVALPVIALTLYPSPSPVVGSIVIPALACAVAVGVSLLAGTFGTGIPAGRSCAMVALAAIALTCGMSVQAYHQSQRGVFGRHYRADVEQVQALYDLVIEESQRAGWKKPRIAVDAVADYVCPPNIAIHAYERDRFHFNPITQLATSVTYTPSAEEAIGVMRQSDFVILATRDEALGAQVYPITHALTAIRPQTRAFCDQSLIRLKSFPMFNCEFTLYMRPTVGMQGNSGGWITSEGMKLDGRADVLSTHPIVELRGIGDFTALGKVPGVNASMTVGKGTAITIPAKMSASGGNYCIQVGPIPSNSLAEESDRVEVHLTFDTHFVPREIGMNNDPRKLVVCFPRDVKVRGSE